MTDEGAESLNRRLLAVEDRLAILELEGAYAAAFDGHKGTRLASLFTKDGTYESREDPDQEVPIVRAQGHEALNRMASTSPSNGIHLMSVPQINVDGDKATSRVHFTFHFGRGGGTNIGYYDVAYAREAEGWRIARRITTYFSRHVNNLTPGYRTDGAFETGAREG